MNHVPEHSDCICFLMKGTNQNPASLVRVTVISVCTLGICGSVTSTFLNQSWILKGICPCFLDSECEYSQLCSIYSGLQHICLSLMDWGKFFSTVAPAFGSRSFLSQEIDDINWSWILFLFWLEQSRNYWNRTWDNELTYKTNEILKIQIWYFKNRPYLK